MLKPFRTIALTLLTLLGLAGGAPVRAETMPWRMDAQRSVIEVGVRSTLEKFSCRVVPFQADVAMERGTQRIERATVSFALSAVKTGRERRDEDLLVWGESGMFSTLSFRLSEMTRGEDGWLIVRGTVTLHGVAKSISFPVRSLVAGTLHTFDGAAVIDYRDFGLPVIRKFFVLSVNPHLEVRFHLQGWLDETAVSAASTGPATAATVAGK